MLADEFEKPAVNVHESLEIAPRPEKRRQARKHAGARQLAIDGVERLSGRYPHLPVLHCHYDKNAALRIDSPLALPPPRQSLRVVFDCLGSGSLGDHHHDSHAGLVQDCFRSMREPRHLIEGQDTNFVAQRPQQRRQMPQRRLRQRGKEDEASRDGNKAACRKSDIHANFNESSGIDSKGTPQRRGAARSRILP